MRTVSASTRMFNASKCSYFGIVFCTLLLLLLLAVFVVPRQALSTREKRTSVAEEDSDEFFEDSDSEMK